MVLFRWKTKSATAKKSDPEKDETYEEHISKETQKIADYHHAIYKKESSKNKEITKLRKKKQVLSKQISRMCRMECIGKDNAKCSDLEESLKTSRRELDEIKIKINNNHKSFSANKRNHDACKTKALSISHDELKKKCAKNLKYDYKETINHIDSYYCNNDDNINVGKIFGVVNNVWTQFGSIDIKDINTKISVQNEKNIKSIKNKLEEIKNVLKSKDKIEEKPNDAELSNKFNLLKTSKEALSSLEKDLEKWKQSNYSNFPLFKYLARFFALIFFRPDPENKKKEITTQINEVKKNILKIEDNIKKIQAFYLKTELLNTVLDSLNLLTYIENALFEQKKSKPLEQDKKFLIKNMGYLMTEIEKQKKIINSKNVKIKEKVDELNVVSKQLSDEEEKEKGKLKNRDKKLNDEKRADTHAFFKESNPNKTAYNYDCDNRISNLDDATDLFDTIIHFLAKKTNKTSYEDQLFNLLSKIENKLLVYVSSDEVFEGTQSKENDGTKNDIIKNIEALKKLDQENKDNTLFTDEFSFDKLIEILETQPVKPKQIKHL